MRLNPTFEVDDATPETVSPRSVVVPNPSPEIESAGIVEVANVDADVVAIKRFPAIARNAQLEFPANPSERASCGAVDVAR